MVSWIKKIIGKKKVARETLFLPGGAKVPARGAKPPYKSCPYNRNKGGSEGVLRTKKG